MYTVYDNIYFDKVITLCGCSIPEEIKAKERIFMTFDDPPSICKVKKLSGEEELNVYRRVRDQIEIYIQNIDNWNRTNLRAKL